MKITKKNGTHSSKNKQKNANFLKVEAKLQGFEEDQLELEENEEILRTKIVQGILFQIYRRTVAEGSANLGEVLLVLIFCFALLGLSMFIYSRIHIRLS